MHSSADLTRAGRVFKGLTYYWGMSTDTTAPNRGNPRAPAPDHPAKPDSPDDLEKRSWQYILRKTAREFSSDQCTDIAAALTYYSVLSIFPALIAIFSLLGVFGQGKAASDAILEIIEKVAPGDTVGAIRGPIEQMATSPAAGIALDQRHPARDLVGVRLRRSVQPCDEPDLRDR